MSRIPVAVLLALVLATPVTAQTSGRVHTARTPIVPMTNRVGAIAGLEYEVAVVQADIMLIIRNGASTATANSLAFWIGLYDGQRRLDSVVRVVISGPVEPNTLTSGNAPLLSFAPSFYRLVYWGESAPDAPRPVMRPFRMVSPSQPGLTYTSPDIALTFSISREQIGFVLRNRSPQPVRVHWEESAFIDEMGRSHRVMHEGVRYTQRG